MTWPRCGECKPLRAGPQPVSTKESVPVVSFSLADRNVKVSIGKGYEAGPRHRCSSRHPPYSVPVLAVTRHIVSQYSPRHPPRSDGRRHAPPPSHLHCQPAQQCQLRLCPCNRSGPTRPTSFSPQMPAVAPEGSSRKPPESSHAYTSKPVPINPKRVQSEQHLSLTS